VKKNKHFKYALLMTIMTLTFAVSATSALAYSGPGDDVSERCPRFGPKRNECKLDDLAPRPTDEPEDIDDVVIDTPEPGLPIIDDEAIPVVCEITVGFESMYWSDAYPEMQPVEYAAFFFQYAPGDPVPAGAKASGVKFVKPYVTISDPNNIFTVAPDPVFFEQVLNSGDYGGTWNWPTPHGSALVGGDNWYRLANDNGPAACGEIVGIGGFIPGS